MLQVRMVRTPDVPDEAFRAAFLGIEELARELTGFPPDVRDYGTDTEWLTPFWDPDRNQLDIARPCTYLEQEGGKYDVDPHIDIVLTTMNLYDITDPNVDFIIGAAVGRTVFVSVHHFLYLAFLGGKSGAMFHELVKQETAHELGHVLGLAVRESQTYEALGTHCVDLTCVMHQGMTVPTDWITAVQYRLARGGRYACPLCHEDAHRNGML